jgi:hypothetical protein
MIGAHTSSGAKEILGFREAVLSAAENSSAVTEKLYRSMNLVDPPTDYSPLLPKTEAGSGGGCAR